MPFFSEITCDKLNISNANIVNPKRRYTKNQRADYECKEGYIGRPIRICEENGWTGDSQCTGEGYRTTLHCWHVLLFLFISVFTCMLFNQIYIDFIFLIQRLHAEDEILRLQKFKETLSLNIVTMSELSMSARVAIRDVSISSAGKQVGLDRNNVEVRKYK